LTSALREQNLLAHERRIDGRNSPARQFLTLDVEHNPTDKTPLKPHSIRRTSRPNKEAASVKNSRLFLSFSPKIKFKHRRMSGKHNLKIQLKPFVYRTKTHNPSCKILECSINHLVIPI
jgi:hypothetical protein